MSRHQDLVGLYRADATGTSASLRPAVLLSHITRFPQEGRIAVMRSNTAVRPAASGGETSGPTKMLLRALNDTAGASIIRPHPYRDVSKSVRTRRRITASPLLRGHFVGLEELNSAMRRELLQVTHDRRWQSYVVNRDTAMRSPMPGWRPSPRYFRHLTSHPHRLPPARMHSTTLPQPPFSTPAPTRPRTPSPFRSPIALHSYHPNPTHDSSAPGVRLLTRVAAERGDGWSRIWPSSR
jgi:hypothetical protein